MFSEYNVCENNTSSFPVHYKPTSVQLELTDNNINIIATPRVFPW